ncbi:BspA family leucine-rich repeat surface protein [Lactococcus petauri]|uniref:BspA family leucine-rich repeat surface protein n=1 Tax=Lactococcus petauri TaxID=1940789 RepID=UPI00255098B9|nr:BspA family leucine-rich repeat surface protein [Lactococcus petauri]
MKNIFRKKIKYKKYSIHVIAVLAALGMVLVLSSIVIPKIMAGDTVVSDLHIQAESEGNIISLHIIDENESDTKVVVPLPDSVTYKLNQTSNIGVTEDTINHQLVIDWVDGQSKDVKLQLEVQKSGVYDFVVQTVREGEPVNSPVSSVKVTFSNDESRISESPNIEKTEPTISEEEHSEEPTQNDQSKASNDPKKSGQIGSVSWTLNSQGELIFSGGQLPSVADVVPWDKSAVKKIIFTAPVYTTENVEELFGSYEDLEDVEGFGYVDTSRATTMARAFSYSPKLKIRDMDFSNFDSSHVIDMRWMFTGADLNGVDLSFFDTSSVQNMERMFNAVVSKELDLSSFDTSHVTTMAGMFMGAYRYNGPEKLDLSSFDTSSVTDMSLMFSNSISRKTYLKKIRLGKKFKFIGSTVNLQYIEENNEFTGKWQNLGSSTSEANPNGKNIWSSSELLGNYNGVTDSDTFVWQPRRSPRVSQNIDVANDNKDGDIFVGDSLKFTTNISNTVADSLMTNTKQIIEIPKSFDIFENSIEIYDSNGNKVNNVNISYSEENTCNKIILEEGAINLLGKGNLTVQYKVKVQERGRYETKSVLSYSNDFGTPQPDSSVTNTIEVKNIDPWNNDFDLRPEDTTKFDTTNSDYPALTTLTKNEKTPMIYKVKNTRAPRDETLTQFDLWLTDVNWKDDFTVDKSSFYIKKSTTSEWEKVAENKIDDTTSIGDKPSYTIKDLNLKLAKGETIEIKFSITAKSAIAIKKNAIAAQGTIEESGSLSSLNSLVVKNGELRFENVPDIMSFEDSKISNRTVESSRKDKDWKITVEDTRLEKKPWRVTTKLLTPFKDTTGADLQSDILLFRKAGQEDQWINNTSETDVYDGTSTKEDYYDVSWSSNEGPLIQVAPGTVKVGQYKGVMQWSIIDAPA